MSLEVLNRYPLTIPAGQCRIILRTVLPTFNSILFTPCLEKNTTLNNTHSFSNKHQVTIGSRLWSRGQSSYNKA